VARRHEIDYRRELLPDEIATGYTWVGELKGPRFERFFRIDGPDGEMCAQSRTDWVLIDIAAKRPARVAALDGRAVHAEGLGLGPASSHETLAPGRPSSS
jgi:acyl-CoA thioesterase FadM